jgi:hypothetical protein
LTNALLNRRVFLFGIGLTLEGCAARQSAPQVALWPSPGFGDAGRYGPIDDDGHSIPGLDLSTIDPDLLRQETSFAGPYRPGTIVVSVPERRLYFVQSGAPPSSAERRNGRAGRRRRA